jgi:hypothetical protein
MDIEQNACQLAAPGSNPSQALEYSQQAAWPPPTHFDNLYGLTQHLESSACPVRGAGLIIGAFMLVSIEPVGI